MKKKKTKQLKQPKQPVHRGGCLCCPQTEDRLPLNTVIYNGFGGWSILKNGKHFWSGDPQGEWKDFPTLQKFENVARKTRAKWEAELYNPLRGATYQRKGKNNWVLTKTNQGFA